MVGSASLADVSKVSNLVAANLVSVGASLAHVHVPGHALALDDFNTGEDIELGMGIHNEAGSKRLKTDLTGLVRGMLAQLLDLKDTDRAFVNITAEDNVVLLVNNLGGVSVLELGCITEEVCAQLEESYALRPVRILAGTFMTSLNGLGFSISILRLEDSGLGTGKSLLELLDAPTEATGWSASVKSSTWSKKLEARQRPSEEDVRELQSSNMICQCSNPQSKY